MTNQTYGVLDSGEGGGSGWTAADNLEKIHIVRYTGETIEEIETKFGVRRDVPVVDICVRDAREWVEYRDTAMFPIALRNTITRGVREGHEWLVGWLVRPEETYLWSPVNAGGANIDRYAEHINAHIAALRETWTKPPAARAANVAAAAVPDDE
ncbi:MAG: hypothetical protein OXG44_17460, partial [Gammaproteobacteria bacterium]|nr:hypothetical protein [Gammaproteobacteria bacterium]